MPPAKPGGAPTAADLANAKAVQEALKDEITRVQKSAQGWATALTGMIGLIATLTVVKGESTVEDLGDGSKIAVAVFIVVAIAAAVVGAYCAARAAYGMPVTVESADLINSRHQAARRARWWLERAIQLTFLSITCAVIAIVGVWFGVESKAPTPSLKFVSEDHPFCVEIEASGDNSLTFMEGKMKRTFDLSEIDAIDVVSSCE
jgi:hypothetical protein